MTTPSWSAMKERDDLNEMKNTWMGYVTIFDDSSDNSDSSMDISFDNDDDSDNSDIISFMIDNTIKMEIDIPMDILLDNDDDDNVEYNNDFFDNESLFSDTTTSSMSSSESLEDILFDEILKKHNQLYGRLLRCVCSTGK
jgi:hypothetical protein